MDMEADTVSGWFVLNAGFKVYGRCPRCQSHRIAYHKVRTPGLKGISATSKGLIPVCTDCGKNLPTQMSKECKSQTLRKLRSPSYS
jgi:DNA-directed RNA polymerase subunit RPC12/RpoP